MYVLIVLLACFPDIRQGEKERFIDNPVTMMRMVLRKRMVIATIGMS